MSKIGSPEWFYEKAQLKENKQIQEEIEKLRFSFLEKYSPEKLKMMSGSDLLSKVFSFDRNSMMYLIMRDGQKGSKRFNYRWFGAAGTWNYLSPIYYDASKRQWKCRMAGNRTIGLRSEKEAEEKAVKARDDILFCIEAIKESEPITTIGDYSELNHKLKKVFFYNYNWMLKYLQMVFPYYFPGMYADHTIERALHILGLATRPSKLENAGQIALFIRKCNINNIVFNNVYADEWTWGDNEQSFPSPCESAIENYKTSHSVNSDPNTDCYKMPAIKVVPSEQVTPQKTHDFKRIQEKISEDAEYVENVETALEAVEDIIDYSSEPKAKPEKIRTKEGTKYQRDSRVGARAIKRAGFSCEINSNHKTFDKKSDGHQYMEAHHIIPMAQQEFFDNSLDVESNVVSLCCNCHRNIHLGVSSTGLLKILYDKRKKEIKKAGIDVSFEDLKKMYE